ncbi:MAG: S8 family serine peptidase [Lysobacterales bacterium]
MAEIPVHRIAVLVFCALLSLAASAHDKVASNVGTALEQSGKAEILVTLADQADIASLAEKHSGDDRLVSSVAALRARAAQSQAPLRAWLDKRGVKYRSFWVANFIALEADAGLIDKLAARRDVAIIELDSRMVVAPRAPGPVREFKAVNAIEAGVNQINAPALWTMGFRGQNVLVAGQDTGYQWDHPALKNQYAGWNGTSASHDYTWHDAIHSSSGPCPGDSPAPCDDNNHGTHTMGTMVGDDGGSNQIGVAPGARWIACRNMDQGNGTPSTYSECFQWLLAPTDSAGNNPDPMRAPHVINNSWGCPPEEQCTTPDILRTVVENVRNAGILIVASAGNYGSGGCSTVRDPPAIYAASFSVGAIGGTSMAGFSSRGPVLVDGSNRLKPDVVAPGVSVRSSVRGGGYASFNWSGTSMAGPHVAGVAALLMSVDPTLKRDPARMEALLRDTAVADITTTENCGGTASPGTVPNNTFGYGRVDALSAARNGLGLLNRNGFE